MLMNLHASVSVGRVHAPFLSVVVKLMPLFTTTPFMPRPASSFTYPVMDTEVVSPAFMLMSPTVRKRYNSSFSFISLCFYVCSFLFRENMMAVSCTFYRHMLGDMVWMCHFPFLSRASLIFYKDTIIFILSPEKTSFLIRKPVLWHPPPYL